MYLASLCIIIFTGKIGITVPILQSCFWGKETPSIYGGTSVAGAIFNVAWNSAWKKVFSLFPLFTSTVPIGAQIHPVPGDPAFPECVWMALEAVLRLQSWGLEVQTPVTCKLKQCGAVKWVWRSESSFFTNGYRKGYWLAPDPSISWFLRWD